MARGLLCSPLQGGWHGGSEPSCSVHVACAGCGYLSAPSPWGRLARPPRTRGRADALEAVGFPAFRLGPPPGATGLLRSPRRVGSGLRRCQGVPVRGSSSVCPASASLASAWAAQAPLGPPTCLTRLSTPTALFVDPGSPSGLSPTRSLWVGFWGVTTSAVCVIPHHGAVSSVRECGLPCGRRGALGTLQRCRSAVRCLLPRCNTRDEGWVRPSSAGTRTLQEAPRFAWRTNAQR